jgi:hypothetical protein
LPSSRILPADVFDDALKVVRRFGRPANLHLQAELLLDAGPHFLMSEELSSIEPIQAHLYLLSEPYVMIEIVLNKLLNVLIRLTAIFRGNTVKLRLQFRSKVHFHGL